MNERPRRWRRLSVAAPILALALLVPAGANAATADLAVDKSDSPDPVSEGAELTYTIKVTNSGPGAASDVVVTDKLPGHVNFLSATASKGGCSEQGNKVTCNLGTLAADPYNVAATVTIKVKPTKAGKLTNTATVAVGAGDTDPVHANDSDTETTTVIASGGGGGGGPTCAGRAATIVGTGGSDTLIGKPGRDVIVARGGNDLIKGRAGNDIVCSGSGNDTAKGGSGNDRLKGGRGRDRLRGGVGDDTMLGGPGRDSCRGGAGADTERSC
jgi:uncharacterized repeat protein (TIGR01451 family)